MSLLVCLSAYDISNFENLRMLASRGFLCALGYQDALFGLWPQARLPRLLGQMSRVQIACSVFIRRERGRGLVDSGWRGGLLRVKPGDVWAESVAGRRLRRSASSPSPPCPRLAELAPALARASG